MARMTQPGWAPGDPHEGWQSHPWMRWRLRPPRRRSLRSLLDHRAGAGRVACAGNRCQGRVSPVPTGKTSRRHGVRAPTAPTVRVPATAILGAPMADDPLARRPRGDAALGYQVVDWLVDRVRPARRDEPVLRPATPAEMADGRRRDGALGGSRDLRSMLDQLESEVLPFRSRIDHPRYLAYVPGEGTWPGALGDLVASTYNIDAGNWMESAGPSQLELLVTRWFADWIGYPDTARGVLVSGGSAANLTALACAREPLVGAMSDDLVVYVSDQGHSSLARAARLLGFRPRAGPRASRRRDRFRMRVDALAAAIAADLAAGRRPLAVLAVARHHEHRRGRRPARDRPTCPAGTASGSTWTRAYGGFAAITDPGKVDLAGLELADSVTLDPHKWLYQPFECRRPARPRGPPAAEAFEIHPDYLQDSGRGHRGQPRRPRPAAHPDESERSRCGCRSGSSASHAFAAAVDQAMDLAERPSARRSRSDDLELMSPAALGIVCFRRHPGGRA